MCYYYYFFFFNFKIFLPLVVKIPEVKNIIIIIVIIIIIIICLHHSIYYWAFYFYVAMMGTEVYIIMSPWTLLTWTVRRHFI